MDTREQLAKARELIKARRFDEAHTLLQSIDHPTAIEWLAKLDQVAPTKQKSSGGGMRVYLLILVLLGVVLAGVLVALNLSNSDDEAPGVSLDATGTPVSEDAPQPTEAAQNAASFDDMQPNTVEINITGDYTASGIGENFEYIPEGSGFFAPRQIILRPNVESTGEPTGRLDLFLYIPDEPPGSYALVDAFREMSDSWGITHSIFGRESWISPEEMTDVDIEGTIDVVENGDTFTGSFEFTTSSTTDDRSMTVSGRIYQVMFDPEG